MQASKEPPTLLPENYQTVQLWSYLEGQVIIHPLKGKHKDDHPQLTVLMFGSIQFLFDTFQVEDRERTFRKLHMLCNYLYNNRDDYAKQESQNSVNSFMNQLMGGSKSSK